MLAGVTVAQGSPSARPNSSFLDAIAVWGGTYERVRDGMVDRSSDGVRICPQDPARFTHRLHTELAKLFPASPLQAHRPGPTPAGPLTSASRAAERTPHPPTRPPTPAGECGDRATGQLKSCSPAFTAVMNVLQ
jgi:hypothetical protein